MTCEHRDFASGVAVNRLEDTGQFMADITIRCVDCGEAFRFLGLRSGLDLRGAMCSPDGTEAKLAIVPKSDKTPGDHALRGFGIQRKSHSILCPAYLSPTMQDHGVKPGECSCKPQEEP